MNEQYRVWNAVNPPQSMYFHKVEGPEEGAALIDRIARLQLRSPYVHSNAFGFEVYEDGEWTEWYDECGENIDAYTEVR